MRHVDDGALHAWLDGQVSDSADAAWIEQHCQACEDCRARLEEARAVLQQAGALLASIAPAAEASRPAYEALVARAARTTDGGGSAAASTAPVRRFRTWQLSAGWAASVALAAALGWMVRDGWTGDEQVPQLASRDVSPQETVAAAPSEAPAVSAPPPETAASPSRERPTPRAERLAQSRAAEPPAAPVPPAQSVPEPFTATAESAVRDALPAAMAPGAVARQIVPPPPSPRSVPPEAAGAAPQVAAAPPPPMPIAAPAPGAGGGRGVGSTVSSAAAAERAARGETPVVDAATPASGAAAQSAAWRAMPRTEAAARTGMALYGITGLAPSMTMLSADGTTVRTIYKTDVGDVVEVWQQRTPSPEATGPDRLGGQMLNSQAGTFGGSWTGTFGGVQVTLRGGADVASWSGRLEVE